MKKGNTFVKNTTKLLKTRQVKSVLPSERDVAQVSIPTGKMSSQELVGKCSFLLLAALVGEGISSDTWILSMAKARQAAKQIGFTDADLGFEKLAVAIGKARDNSYHRDFIG